MGKWGIIGAMEEEISLLIAAMEDTVTHTVGGRTYYEGTIEGHAVALTKCGTGKVFAAMAAQILIDRFAVTKLINIGVAGGIGTGMHVGDMVLSTDAVWFGITYKEDKAYVMSELKKLHESGVYPAAL